MNKQFTASEVRDAITWKYGDKLTRVSAMLTAYADLLEAQERAVPVMVVNHVSSAEHDLPIGMKLYAHPVPSDAERLAEALHSIGELVKATLQHTYEPHKSDLSDVREEAVQTAAMALRFVRSIDRYEFARCKRHSQTSAMAKESGR